jgi:hypothetical protein
MVVLVTDISESMVCPIFNTATGIMFANRG